MFNLKNLFFVEWTVLKWLLYDSILSLDAIAINDDCVSQKGQIKFRLFMITVFSMKSSYSMSQNGICWMIFVQKKWSWSLTFCFFAFDSTFTSNWIEEIFCSRIRKRSRIRYVFHSSLFFHCLRSLDKYENKHNASPFYIFKRFHSIAVIVSNSVLKTWKKVSIIALPIESR